MRNYQLVVALAVVALLTCGLLGCGDSSTGPEGSGEHGNGGEGPDNGGEESATQYAQDETMDEIYNGVRLILSYDPQSVLFSGTVQNTTGGTLTLVRVEVHLSTGIELGPTTPADLGSGETRNVTLQAPDNSFVTWSGHPETGSGGGEGSEGSH